MQNIEINTKKNLGAYYTPIEAAKILCDWAVQESSDKILEPSFGGCGFLEACQDRLLELKCPKPLKQLYGYDKDENAFTHYLIPKFGLNDFSDQFLNKDFLKAELGDFKVKKFNAIVGNPPYVSYHNMTLKQRDAANRIIDKIGFKYKGKASLWYSFVIHSLNFLKDGGRIAWVLPSSFIFSDYSKSLLNYIEEHFNSSIAIQLGQRLFKEDGTDEISVMLLAKGFNNTDSKKKFKITYSNKLLDLKEKIKTWESGSDINEDVLNSWSPYAKTSDITNLIKKVSKETKIIKLQDIALVKIGLVTGANKFFVINKTSKEENKIDSDCLTGIFSKTSFTKGVTLTKKDLEKAEILDQRSLLINTSSVSNISTNLQKYLNSFPIEERENNKTFENRSPWHEIKHLNIPDAFLTYMSIEGPKFIINKAKANSTNTIHRIYFIDKVKSFEKKLYAISLLSSFGQLSAELVGKIYGSGVLKLEPSAAKQIQLILPGKIDRSQINKTFISIEKKLRKDDKQEARMIADEYIFSDLSSNLKKQIQNKLIELREKRQRKY